MENIITANNTLTSYSVLETLGLLFYVASPSGTSYERIDECPDFVSQVNQGFQREEYLRTHPYLHQGHPLHRYFDHPRGHYQPFSPGPASEPGGQCDQHLQRPADDGGGPSHQGRHGQDLRTHLSGLCNFIIVPPYKHPNIGAQIT